MRAHPLVLLLSVPALLLASPAARGGTAHAASAPIEEGLPAAESIVRVNSTNQPYDFTKPWTKKPPFTRRGIGVVMPDQRVLVTAELVANHSYVELERPGNSQKFPADVQAVDYESNLALIRPTDPAFFEGTKPVELAGQIKVGSAVNVLQLENTGALALTPAVVTTITVAPYPADGVALLAYRLSAPLQYRESSFTLPVFLGNRLAGLLMRYDTRTQSADIVPDAVISSFLARADAKPYRGFPRAGIAFAPTRDPQFRRYLGMNGQTGVYVVSVTHGGSAEKAGLRKGDVVMSVSGYPIDEDGNYEDPQFGKIPFSYLVSTANLPGSRLPMTVLRDGKTLELELPLEPRDPATVVSEPIANDRAPRYFILGGLVFQELSRAYLREWGGDWRNNAPSRLVYLDEFQDELPPGRGKIVFLSQVLPADTTLGYDDLGANVVTRINGREIRRLEDIAEAAKSPVDGFHKVELESDPGVLFLNAEDVEKSANQLKASYGLPSLDNLQ